MRASTRTRALQAVALALQAVASALWALALLRVRVMTPEKQVRICFLSQTTATSTAVLYLGMVARCPSQGGSLDNLGHWRRVVGMIPYTLDN